ncbi:hypothetical protein HGP14_27710 [Rhizobium sp. P32RR-XVIII]|uniref:hypothetical protein n=1 Tax=Rhizobium sp. P32RR-XVIII TaxID=2726738 RepID=UPI0014568114|nr:hypothetical protein [Rhizobium sp. P32RR-XVIII]NLS07090.1 hypothetical protein [Rhizobium sp. P32RR-XVIII]
MKSVILAAAFLLPSSALAVEAVNVNSGAYTCNELAQIIRQQKAVFVRVGFGGRSFRYPPARCRLGDKRDTTSLRDANGKMCILDYACVYDPASSYNWSFGSR